jgi:hypothetical protein
MRGALFQLRHAVEVKIDPTLLFSAEGGILGIVLKVFVADGAVMVGPYSVGLECLAEVS